MPRNGSGVYSADWVNAAPNTTIESAKQNAMVADLVADANAARPITAGGTAGTTAVEGIDNLSTKGTNIASAATTDIGAATGRFVHITGTTSITSFGTKTAGVERELVFDGALTLTHNATSLILPGAANITTAAGDTSIFVSEGSGNWRCVLYQRAASGAVATIVQQVFESSGTYTPTAGMVFCIVECIGGGGGSGGATSAVGKNCGSGGGGGGGYSRSRLTAAQVGASQTVTIGAGGSAGTSSTNGGAGGDTSFGVLVIGKGGQGSSAAAAGVGTSGGEGGVLGSGAFGTLGAGGHPGSGGEIITVGVQSGKGGDGPFGGGPRGRYLFATSAIAGTAGGRFGAGASGAVEHNQATGAAGAAGSAGAVIVTEYCV